MSTTRARRIRAAIAQRLTSATLDRRDGSDDKLRFLRISRRPETARERTFRITASVPSSKGTLQTSDDYRVEHTIEIFYALGPDVDDRVCDDAERFWWALETLQSADDGIIDSTPTPLGIEDGPNYSIARTSVVTRYRLDSSLVA